MNSIAQILSNIANIIRPAVCSSASSTEGICSSYVTALQSALSELLRLLTVFNTKGLL